MKSWIILDILIIDIKKKNSKIIKLKYLISKNKLKLQFLWNINIDYMDININID